MEEYKRKKIETIKDEVMEFHPLLDRLFIKIPKVTKVEYTHGQYEMGADFIVMQENDLFRKVDNIGVIAKVGKITQNFSDIERQISECALPRLINNGKDKIVIDEIWIINNETISNNAQEKIHHNYAEKKVRFIDCTQLINWIDDYFPSYWIDIPLALNDYLFKINTFTRDIDKNLSLINIQDKDFYIEQDVFQAPEIKYQQNTLKQSKPKIVNIYDEIKNHRLLLLEGGAGAGKSKLIRHLILHYSDPNNYIQEKVIPIFTTCKEVIDNYSCNVSKLIDEKLNIQRSILDETDEVILFIDGIDEKDIEPEKQIENLSSLLDVISKLPKTKALIASRYLSGLDKNKNIDHNLIRYELPPLSLKKTIEFLTILCKSLNLKTRLLEDLKKSQLLREMPKSPIAAILLARLLNENSIDLPSNLTELYQKYTELMLGRWDIEKGLETNKTYQVLDRILIIFAQNILDYQMQNMTLGDAKQLVNDYLGDRNLGVTADDIMEILMYRCDLLGLDKSNHTIGFKHRTFAEFFYAKQYQYSEYPGLKTKVFNFYWMNTVFFYLGIKKDAPEVLKEILLVNPTSEFERWIRIINMGNYLLAAYASPYSIVTDAISSIFQDASQLYIDIVTRKINSPFSLFSQMDLLCLMQYLIRDSYSYEFFTKALEDSVLNIDYSDLLHDQKAYSLFFINMAYMDINPEYDFEKILDKYITGMPIDLSLAVFHEIKKIDRKSELIKKYQKKLHRVVDKDKSVMDKINKLYKVPIKNMASRSGSTKDNLLS